MSRPGCGEKKFNAWVAGSGFRGDGTEIKTSGLSAASLLLDAQDSGLRVWA